LIELAAFRFEPVGRLPVRQAARTSPDWPLSVDLSVATAGTAPKPAVDRSDGLCAACVGRQNAEKLRRLAASGSAAARRPTYRSVGEHLFV
jgi:hypothetical protein